FNVPSHVTILPSCHLPCLANHPPPTRTYTLSLHDALPISSQGATRRNMSPGSRSWNARSSCSNARSFASSAVSRNAERRANRSRSEEHTSELQSHLNLVCRLLLEKKKKKITNIKNAEHITL